MPTESYANNVSLTVFGEFFGDLVSRAHEYVNKIPFPFSKMYKNYF